MNLRSPKSMRKRSHSPSLKKSDRTLHPPKKRSPFVEKKIKGDRIPHPQKSDRIPHPSKKPIALPILKKLDRIPHPQKNRSHSSSPKSTIALLIPKKRDRPFNYNSY
ncbi:hypothetical protein [Argonema galeatum]|uniref:hypothetical protein n=1 Tax=Argonema galeatum TaxID=2942762 RepID=UPI0020127EC1|nr:hypothetical protein [Argonema galeatum]MCL1464363.1 hypothetical protein [Argonema galeatum A003/A1]